jgi:hypothetical protein
MAMLGLAVAQMQLPQCSPSRIAIAASTHRFTLPLRRRASPLCAEAFNEGNPPPAGDPTAIGLMEKAKYFLSMKNVQDVDAIIAMCAPCADLYGFIGTDACREGLATLFNEQRMLMHILLTDPEPLEANAVQFAFEKSWRDSDGELMQWSSIDPVPEDADGRPLPPRDQVERLEFDAQGRLVKASIEERERAEV